MQINLSLSNVPAFAATPVVSFEAAPKVTPAAFATTDPVIAFAVVFPTLAVPGVVVFKLKSLTEAVAAIVSVLAIVFPPTTSNTSLAASVEICPFVANAIVAPPESTGVKSPTANAANEPFVLAVTFSDIVTVNNYVFLLPLHPFFSYS